MALLTLVRHGQASFLAENYDKLSQLGERQAQKLGAYWARTNTAFDQVYFGPAERHIRTGQIALETCEAAGVRWPEPMTLPEVDEYPGIEVMRMFLPGLMEKHEDIRAMEAQFRSAADKDAAARVFEILFQRVTRMWVAEEIDSPEIESWRRFCERIDAGLAKVREAAGRSRRILVFTSGGVLAATARAALDLSPQKTLELSWASRNASYAEFLFSSQRFSLASFNNVPHLDDPAYITYR